MRRKTKSTNPTLRKIDALARIDRFGDALKRLEAVDLRALKPADVEAALAIDLECTRALGIRWVLSARWAAALSHAAGRAPEVDFGARITLRFAEEARLAGDHAAARALASWGLARRARDRMAAASAA